MKNSNQPTASELEILDILWERRAATVREVFEEVATRRPTTYTTILKFMQIMQEKGMVVRDEKERAHVYKPRESQRTTQQRLVGTLLERAFRGSATSLVQHVLEASPTSSEDLAAIRRMIDEAEAKGAKK